ncbi:MULTISPECIES: tripartite tricarboxylate transporter substrate binding protein [unclassified Devosia]|uniref:tripartite tricarboxylate transporter substrate binding protein n=1 Tax=unclassified Devosia TaxID=196773 RepID=UPI00145C89CE|nr:MULTISPECIES: tripartite tricarboxylate transporter substrate binding protein [unclassified Devosia]MBJ6989111.1 tripartite tricarboxylate transporter substrate binding protein [Devosia sp. MC521]QMW63312.1 tripartite tricarboxylate transporter substrate binding protein [Devosia sp. MC521]
MSFRLSAAVVAAAALFSSSALAQDAAAYPERPVTLVVPYNPGGSSDAAARLVGQSLSEQFGQPFVVENKPGASGVIGTEFVAKSDADGQTVLFHTSAIGIHAAFNKNLPYDTTEDLRAVSIVAGGPFVLVAHPSLPANTVAELVDYAKANPGALNMGSAGVGGSGHLIGERFQEATGIEMVHIPYAGGGPSQVGLMANEVQVVFDTLTATSLIKEGKLKALAVTSPERWMELPDVPTMAEAGFPDSTVTIWVGAFVPKATPDAIVEKLSAGIAKAVEDQTITERLVAVGMTPTGSNPYEADVTLGSDIAGWQALAATGLTID